MRLPNGYGSVTKCQGKLRKPWRVFLGAEYSSDGRSLTTKRRVLGYYSTKREALDALHAYHMDPTRLDCSITFSDIFGRWMKEKRVSKTTVTSYKAAFNKCVAIHDTPINEIKLAQLQAVLDTYPNLSKSSLDNIIVVMKGVFTYALRNDLISKDPSAYVTVRDYADPTGKHKPFTAREIASLWAMPQSRERDITLILLYTGWRVRELLEMPRDKVDVDALIMTGGKKTKAGKDRVVPIHSRIVPLVEQYMKKPEPFHCDYTTLLNWMMEHTGHRCHDTRHTFISELQSRGADKVCVERLVGHVSKGVTDKVYTHKDIAELRSTVELVQYKDITMSAAM